MESDRHGHQHAPGLSLWPVGVAAGVGCILVGLIVSWWIVAVGAGLCLVFGFLWVWDMLTPEAPEPAAAAGPPAAGQTVRRPGLGEGHETTRKGFLSAATLGFGAAIGGIVTVPPLIFAGVPPFRKGEGFIDLDVDLGPLDNYPQDQWLITKFNITPEKGDVADRTAYVRFNGELEGQPSFTIISNRCVHLGCPVQANGPTSPDQRKSFGSGQKRVELTPVLPAGFGCPCHGGQYDTEGNRRAGPPVRALDRYAYKIKDGRLVLVGAYSVSDVNGTGSGAKLGTYRLAAPGIHLDGVSQVLYPFIPPS